MDGRQKVALWAGILLVVAMGIYPPWMEIVFEVSKESREASRPVENSIGYAWIFRPPRSPSLRRHLDATLETVQTLKSVGVPVSSMGEVIARFETMKAFVRIDYPRLLLQWVLVAIVTAGAIITVRDRNRSFSSQSHHKSNG